MFSRNTSNRKKVGQIRTHNKAISGQDFFEFYRITECRNCKGDLISANGLRVPCDMVDFEDTTELEKLFKEMCLSMALFKYEGGDNYCLKCEINV